MRHLPLLFLIAARCDSAQIASFDPPTERPNNRYTMRVRFWIEPPTYRYVEVQGDTEFAPDHALYVGERVIHCPWTERCEAELVIDGSITVVTREYVYYLDQPDRVGFDQLSDWEVTQ